LIKLFLYDEYTGEERCGTYETYWKG
jgi:hypothetical protein